MLPDIYEYRLYVDRRKADLEKSKVRASMMAASPTVPLPPPNRIFGEELMVTVKRDNAPVPKFITESFNYIKEKALDEEGIFRVSGNKREVMDVKAKIDQGQLSGIYNEVHDPAVVASLIKMYLRELPEPLLSFDRYQPFLDTINIDDQEERVTAIAKLVSTLPPANHELLRQLLDLCTLIASHKSTKMGAANLATVLAPNLLISNSENVHVDDVAIGNMVITAMVQHFDKIFPEGSKKTCDWVTDINTSSGKSSSSGKGTVRHRPTHSAPSPPNAPSSSSLSHSSSLSPISEQPTSATPSSPLHSSSSSSTSSTSTTSSNQSVSPRHQPPNYPLPSNPLSKSAENPS